MKLYEMKSGELVPFEITNLLVGYPLPSPREGDWRIIKSVHSYPYEIQHLIPLCTGVGAYWFTLALYKTRQQACRNIPCRVRDGERVYYEIE